MVRITLVRLGLVAVELVSAHHAGHLPPAVAVKAALAVKFRGLLAVKHGLPPSEFLSVAFYLLAKWPESVTFLVFLQSEKAIGVMFNLLVNSPKGCGFDRR